MFKLLVKYFKPNGTFYYKNVYLDKKMFDKVIKKPTTNKYKIICYSVI